MIIDFLTHMRAHTRASEPILIARVCACVCVCDVCARVCASVRACALCAIKYMHSTITYLLISETNTDFVVVFFF